MVELCNELRLGGIAAQQTVLAEKAAEKRASFTDFVEELLSVERAGLKALLWQTRDKCWSRFARRSDRQIAVDSAYC